MRITRLGILATLVLALSAPLCAQGGSAPPPPPPPPGTEPIERPAVEDKAATDSKPTVAPKPTGPFKAQKGAGEPAPRLSDVDWMIGKPVKQWTRGTAYLLFFFAPWDQDGLRTLPHLAELQKKHAGDRLSVIVIGIQEKAEVVPFDAFVERRKATLTAFLVGKDKLDKTTAAWNTLVGLQVPRVVLVDRNSRVAWSGHPLNGMDGALAAMLAEDKAAMETVVNEQRAMSDKLKAQFADLEQAMATEGGEQQVIDAIDALAETNGRYAGRRLRFKYSALLKLARKDDAAAWGRKLVSDYISDSEVDLNDLAWYIVDPKGPVKEGDLELAALAAERANQLAGGLDAAILDTLARVRWRQGDKAGAIALQEQGIKLAWTGAMRELLQKGLDEYRAPPKK